MKTQQIRQNVKTYMLVASTIAELSQLEKIYFINPDTSRRQKEFVLCIFLEPRTDSSILQLSSGYWVIVIITQLMVVQIPKNVKKMSMSRKLGLKSVLA